MSNTMPGRRAAMTTRKQVYSLSLGIIIKRRLGS
jgi:hypothetical protein